MVAIMMSQFNEGRTVNVMHLWRTKVLPFCAYGQMKFRKILMGWYRKSLIR